MGRRVPGAVAPVAAPAGDARHVPELGAVRPGQGVVAVPAHRRVRGGAHVRLHRRGRAGRGARAPPARRAARLRPRHRVRVPHRPPRPPAVGARHRGRLVRPGRPARGPPRRRRGGRLPRRERPRGAGDRARGRAVLGRGDARVPGVRPSGAEAHRRGADGGRAPPHPAAHRASARPAGDPVDRGAVGGDAPRWARRLYGLPGLPTTDLSTTVTLRALQSATALLPDLPAPPNVERARRLVRAGARISA